MANAHLLKKPKADQIQEFVADASLAIDVGDLMYHTGDDAKPASSQADQGSEGANQFLFAKNFLGVSNSARLSSQDSAGVVRIQVDGLIELTCTSATFEIGDYVGADEDGTGTALEDQSVKKVTSRAQAIGRVVQRYASATTSVWVQLLTQFSRMEDQNHLAGWIAQTIDMADAALTLTKVPGTPTGTFLYGNLLLVDPNSGGITENLLLPHEADCVDELLIIKNTGGEHIDLQNDAGGAVCTIEDSEFAIVHCDGTTWSKIQAVETT